MNTNCLFCKIRDTWIEIVCENDLFFSMRDANPVSPWHALIIPKSHIDSFFDLSDQQIILLYALIWKTKETIENKFNPDWFNIWINDWEAAWRTIHHLHIHLIPRYIWDIPNPRWGIRHLIPWKGDY